MGAKGGEIEGIRSTDTAAVICHGLFSSEGFVLVEFSDFGTENEKNIIITLIFFPIFKYRIVKIIQNNTYDIIMNDKTFVLMSMLVGEKSVCQDDSGRAEPPQY